eukprot:CAMPEP_0176347292 /NCGR_PEP_ID=MMETSP0126-20121128/6937_1 /TAXON_ID=141414 ORGANISM="Strombidinopsis acuminatum, Strain SPMC142" /NCGR_SAMPLE_ID=MMETSP0126 /ASSEMBLY_ACC=CAM_ASM_000229 /LENGTH=118 /DNA_ID=CAMNT_0017695373 /DNA_START=131 /DNA_END=487 /DNA_ORIENTATION=+
MSGVLPITVTQITTEATLEQFREFLSSWCEIQTMRDKNVHCTVLGDDEGAMTYHQHMETPFILNDKEFIAAAYHIVGENESTFVISTKGNDALYEKHADKLNKKRDRGNVSVIYFNAK